jgi:hypothetical protein
MPTNLYLANGTPFAINITVDTNLSTDYYTLNQSSAPALSGSASIWDCAPCAEPESAYGTGYVDHIPDPGCCVNILTMNRDDGITAGGIYTIDVSITLGSDSQVMILETQLTGTATSSDIEWGSRGPGWASPGYTDSGTVHPPDDPNLGVYSPGAPVPAGTWGVTIGGTFYGLYGCMHGAPLETYDDIYWIVTAGYNALILGGSQWDQAQGNT